MSKIFALELQAPAGQSVVGKTDQMSVRLGVAALGISGNIPKARNDAWRSCWRSFSARYF
jgi:hypothetical protein